MKLFLIFLTIATVVLMSVTAKTVHAYSVNATGGGGGTVQGSTLGDPFLPFENFIHSLGSVGPNAIWTTGGSPAAPLGGMFSNIIHNALVQFDAWLFGIAGFHILDLGTAILSILSWLLGLIKGWVDWLLRLIHMA